MPFLLIREKTQVDCFRLRWLILDRLSEMNPIKTLKA